MTRARLILASASPRRAALLQWAGVEFDLRPAGIDERRRAGEDPADYAARLAREKALAGDHGPALVLGADTTVALGGRILEKPSGPDEARRHLADLSGRAHEVITAFCLAAAGRALTVKAVTSRVTFRPLTAAMIEAYAATGEGLDKAGGYGLQGLGGFLVEDIAVSYTNVVGLPLTEVLAALRQFGGPPAP